MVPERSGVIATVIAFFLLALPGASWADTYTVGNTNQSGVGSLAQAILDSNARTGQDTIAFNIPGPGVHLIDLSTTALPEITDSLIVDGYTQPGAHPNTLGVGDDAVILIQLDGGSNKSGKNGLSISAGGCLVRGLAITGFTVIESSDPFYTVTGGFGISLKGPGAGHVIEGNFIGLNPDGLTAKGNYNGVRIGVASQVRIGGADPAARNVISGNRVGVAIYNGSAGTGMVLSGNYVGTDASGMRAVGNDFGLELGVPDAVVGGTAPFAGNVISGNQYHGLELGGHPSYHTFGPGDRALVQGNLIGTTADGVGPLGNGDAGIIFVLSSNSTIGGPDPAAANVIAFNDQGIVVHGTGNSILSNSIYGNNTRGIVLDGASSNNAQSAPIITSETISHGIATISGTLQSAANTQFLIQFFADSQSLTTSGQTYLGSANVTTNSSGQGSFTARFPVFDNNVVFNATATAPTAPNGSTSEFSRNPAYLQNLSARASVGTGGDALIAGLIIRRYASLLVRGIGPSLQAYGLSGVLAEPTLEFHDGAGVQMFNDNWKDDQNQAASIQQSGLAPGADAESATMPFSGPTSPFRPSILPFAPYTAILRGKADTTGIGVLDAFGLAYPGYGSFARLANLSARGFVGTGDNIIVGGFIIGGGNESTRVVVRAMGPSLQAAGVTNSLPDPMIELHDSNGLTIKSNDDWEQAQGSDLQTVGLAPGDAAESAILTRLQPGAYSAVVRGKGNATGVALVEIYRLP